MGWHGRLVLGAVENSSLGTLKKLKMERSAARPAAAKAQEPLKESEDLANMRAATCMTCFVHDSHNDIQDRRGQDGIGHRLRNHHESKKSHPHSRYSRTEPFAHEPCAMEPCDIRRRPTFFSFSDGAWVAMIVPTNLILLHAETPKLQGV